MGPRFRGGRRYAVMIRIGYDTLAPAEAAIRAVLDAGQDAFRRGCVSPLQHSFRLRTCLDFLAPARTLRGVTVWQNHINARRC
jgi:hypothetical protein